MRKTILRLMGLILGLEGILTIGLTVTRYQKISIPQMITSKESFAVLLGLMLWMLSEWKLGGLYEN